MKLNTFQRVRALSDWKAVAFAATLLERSLPNYLLFCEACEFEGAEQYRHCLNLVWEWLASPKSKFNISVQLERIEEATPDAGQYDSYGVYPAIDVAMSMAALLQLMSGEDPQGAVVASKLSQGSVEAFIEATAETEVTAEDIKQHPLMQWEVSLQNEVLDYLDTAKRGKETTDFLKQQALSEGMSNIGIAIN